MSTWDELTWPGIPEKRATAGELSRLRLCALEEKLAEARRLLLQAVRVDWRSRDDVRALAELAAGVHHEVLRELERSQDAHAGAGRP